MRHELSSRGCFFVGTDTEVGKTFQAAALARRLVASGIKVGVYKPVQSGSIESQPSDAQSLYSAAQLSSVCPIERVCPQQFSAPLAPPMAARLEGRQVNEDLLFEPVAWWLETAEFLIIETAGGVLSPLSDSLCVLDFIQRLQLDFPLIVIAANRLGVVNHALLTIEAIQRRGLSVAAVHLNTLPVNLHTQDCSTNTNLELLRQFAPDGLLIESDATRIWEALQLPRRRMIAVNPRPMVCWLPAAGIFRQLPSTLA